MNRACCGKSTKFGTHVHHTKSSKFSYSAKPDFPCGGCGGHFKNGRYVTISQKLRGEEPSVSTLHISFFWGVYFRKSNAEYIMPLYPPFWRPFIQNGGHLQSKTSISDTKRRRAFKFDSMSRFCGAWISEKVLPNSPCHCIHHFRGDLKKTRRPFPK